ncbi:phenylpyruvate tautomerase MIF-related protein [Limosilactobacillus reuteri]|uniref:phenylpyruvate tautomerase MIF-related protein n=1 Tax=Limosilactobacillus reuteri TaxID=1598 RepID=UPI0014341A82|nr:phenylpyruvate tautomerase MIF-related protein [Limosilactobacillus reuteri]MRH31268.1 hypothetical protein [Limosilactobacillus reuteri]
MNETPFIMSRVNIKISKNKELMLKKRLGLAIANVPGKSEKVLMVGFQDNYPLYLRGNGNEPLAYIEVSIFGTESHTGYEGLNTDITKAFYDILGIQPDHLYIKYDDISSWGVQGEYIDRRDYL